MRAIFQNSDKGEYEDLVQELEADRELYFRYMRMSMERFENLFSLVEDRIKKQDTRLRKAI